MKIVLVLPDQTKLDELKGWWYPPPDKRKGKPVLPSLGMLYLCSAIKPDHDAVYIDNSVHKLDDVRLVEDILRHNPDVVGFGGTMQEWPQASDAAALIKRLCPSVITVYGGPNATARPEKHIHYFDYIFRGMAEHSLKEFLDRLQRRQPLAGIPGLCSRIFDSIAAPVVEVDLDALPWPDRAQIDLTRYRRKTDSLCPPTDVVMTSRGCPFDCRFCSSQFIGGRRYHKRSAELVLDEIRFMKEVYGTRSLHFREDNLTVDRERLRRICQGLANMGLEWTCQSRISSLNEDTVRMMKDSGCRLISCGFESVNDATLKYLRKRQTAAQIFTIIDIFERVGVHYTGGFIVASPNETRQEIINTIRFAQELSTFPHSRITPAVTRFVGIPVSELYYKIIEDGLVEFNWQDGELLFPRTYAMSSAEIDELIRQAYAVDPETAIDDSSDNMKTAANQPACLPICNAAETAGPKKIALIVAMPQRLEGLRYVIRSIQPQVDEIRVLINNTGQVPQDVAAMDKVTAVRTDPTGSLYASGVWTLLKPDDCGYILVLDDDIAYPSNYADTMITVIERHKRHAVAVVHGMDYREPFADCIDDRVVYRFQKAKPTESVVHTGGVGTLVFHTDTLRPAVADFPNPNFRDLWFSILAAQKKIPIVCVARDEGWLKQIQTADQSLWNMSRQPDWRRQKNAVFRTQLVPLLAAQHAAADEAKFSVFSITNGRSTFEYSLRSLKKAYPGEITVLRDRRWLEALNTCVQCCTTPYFFRMDDDFIVHPAALAYMQKQVLGFPEPDKLGIYYCHLWEDWTQRVRESIKVYSVAALRAIGGFHADDKGKVDRVTNRMLEEAGYRVVGDPSAVALHACGDWQEQLNYESLWSAMAAAPYKKPTHEAMKQYCGTKTLDQQYAMRKGFLERLNAHLKTPFDAFIKDAAAAPKVSVIMACHNAEKYLAESLDSILNQTLTDWELLAVDDASADRTRDILRRYAANDSRIRIWLCDDNKGPYVRRNFAIQQSRAPFICIHDADDLMRRDKLMMFYEAISKDDRLGVVGSYNRRFLETAPADEEFGDCLTKIEKHEDLMAAFPQTWYLCSHGSAIIRKSLFETLGLYDEQPWGSDAFWLAKAGLYAMLTGRIRVGNLPHCLTYVRSHSASQTGTIIYEDPRSRRHRHKAYFRQKLTEVAEQYKADPSIDLAARLRACNVNDFIPRFGRLFAQWESEPVTETMMQAMQAQLRADIENAWFVTAVIKLNVLERMEPQIALRWPDFRLLRAAAYYAIGHDDKARQDIDCLPTAQKDRFAFDFSLASAAARKRRIVAFCTGRTPPRQSAQSVSSPLVSVIMPAYNAAAYIKQAIDSVLAQTDRRFELLVINDGSTDATESIVKSVADPRVKLLSQSNAGPSAARNAGLRIARGDFIVFLDSDDLLTPDFIAQHLSAFERTPQADLIYCDYSLVDESGRPLRIIERAEYPDRRRLIADLFRNGYPIISFRHCIRRSVFDKIGLYDERLGVSEDYDMLRRFIRHGLTAVHLSGAFYIRRMTADSQSRTFTRDKARMHFEAIRTFGRTFSPAELFADIEWSKIPTDRHAFTACLYTAKNFIAIGQDYQRSGAAELMAETAFAFAAEPLEQCLALCPNDPDVARLLNLCRQYEQRLAETAI